MVIKCLEVNGHSLDSITREFLLDGVDQNVQESWPANYMEVDVFTTRGSPIAGMISGVLTSGDLEVDKINNVSVSDLILKYGSQHQVISGKKILHGGIHIAGDILAATVNGLDFVELNQTLVRVDQNAIIEAAVVWIGPVIFPELTVSGTTTIDQTVNIRNPLEGSSATQSLEEYVAAVGELQTEVQLLKDAPPTVLYHSGQQAITGFINAASLAVDNAHFDELTLHKVNGHSLDSITREFLLDGVDQKVQESWRANYMEEDVFTTLGSPIAGTISGVLTSGRFSAT
ncbi:uncharacterized protein [Panulirus ornatus]|uniref:uncharacterized protein isoform X1 n=1 Tax=Panulirus ornatus TaxID=150431 RepID=UPI003A89D85C